MGCGMCARGSYRGFFNNNIQADWVHISDIQEYNFLYLPFPIMLSKETVASLSKWVKNGGKIVSEGCPAYFDENGRVNITQPPDGLTDIFGAKQVNVEFTADLFKDLTFYNTNDVETYGGIFRQEYKVTTGEPRGWYENGGVAVVDNEIGEGHTKLIGTFPDAGQTNHPKENDPFYLKALDWAGKEQHLKSSDSRITARIHKYKNNVFIWVTNPTEKKINTKLKLSQKWGSYQDCEIYWGQNENTCVKSKNIIYLEVGRRNAAVLKLK